MLSDFMKFYTAILDSWLNITALIITLILTGLALRGTFKQNSRFKKYAKQSPSILATVGIFFSFLGIALALMDFDPKNIEESIPHLLDGLKVKFIASLMGIVASIIVKIAQTFNSKNDVSENVDNEQVMIDLLKDIKESLSENQQNSPEQLLTELKDTIALLLPESKKQSGLLEAVKTSLAGEGDASVITQLKLVKAEITDLDKHSTQNFENFGNQNKQYFGVLDNTLKNGFDSQNTVLNENFNKLTIEFDKFEKVLAENNSEHLIEKQSNLLKFIIDNLEDIYDAQMIRGKNNPAVASSLYRLAIRYYNQKKYTEAEPLYKRALEIRIELFGENNSAVAGSLNSLANCYYSQQKYTEAKPLYQRALETRIELFGENNSDVAISLNSLANCYYCQEKYTEAEPFYKHALEIRIELFGENHQDVATSLTNLSDCYYCQEKYTEAEPLYKGALEIRIKLFGKNHRDVATSLTNLSDCYYIQGKYTEAESLYKRALETRIQLFGENHQDVATSLTNLANCYNQIWVFYEAEPLYQRALAIRIKLFGKNHPSVTSDLTNLAGCYEKQGKNKELDILYQSISNKA